MPSPASARCRNLLPRISSASGNRSRVRFLEPPAKVHVSGMIPVAGLMLALVPALPEASMVALREYGTKSLAEVIAPAIDLADGSAIDEMRSGSIEGSREFFTIWPTSMKHFVPNGRVPMPGEIFHQADLAATLRGLVAAEKKALDKGGSRAAGIDAARDYFYRGEIAKKIDTFSKANNGLLRYDDMAAFRLTPEDPLYTDFHGYRVYKTWVSGAKGPGDDDRDAEHAERHRSELDEVQLRRLHQHSGGSAKAGLRRSRYLLRRSEIQQNPHRNSAFHELCEGAARAYWP